MAIEIEAAPSVQLSRVADSEKHGENLAYFAGWKAHDEDPYNEASNPSGVIQMGLAENQVSILQHQIDHSWFLKSEFFYDGSISHL